MFSNIDVQTFYAYLGGLIIFLLILCFLIRWAVRADSIVKNQEAMIWFLILQCKKSGATDEEIQKIKDHYHIK